MSMLMIFYVRSPMCTGSHCRSNAQENITLLGRSDMPRHLHATGNGPSKTAFGSLAGPAAGLCRTRALHHSTPIPHALMVILIQR